VHTLKDQTRGSTRRRRLHDRAFKDDPTALSLVAGASVAAIAMKGGINANLPFKWRREHVLATPQAAPAAATLLPVCVLPDVTPTPTPQPIAAVGPVVSRHTRVGVIEVEIAGAQLRLRGAGDEEMLLGVLRALRRNA
jgi:transposase